MVPVSIVLGQVQDVRSELIRLSEKYNQLQEFTLEIEYVMYDRHIGGVEIDRIEGAIQKGKGYLKFEIGSLETLLFDSISFSIDHEDKRILIGEPSLQALNSLAPTAVLDQFLNVCESWEVSTISADESSISFECPHSELFKGELFYNPNLKTIQRTIMYYNSPSGLFDNEPQQPRLEINYTSFKARIAENWRLTTATIDQLTSGRVLLNGKFHKYNVIDSRL
jgi:hypothetical protein